VREKGELGVDTRRHPEVDEHTAQHQPGRATRMRASMSSEVRRSERSAALEPDPPRAESERERRYHRHPAEPDAVAELSQELTLTRARAPTVGDQRRRAELEAPSARPLRHALRLEPPESVSPSRRGERQPVCVELSAGPRLTARHRWRRGKGRHEGKHRRHTALCSSGGGERWKRAPPAHPFASSSPHWAPTAAPRRRGRGLRRHARPSSSRASCSESVACVRTGAEAARLLAHSSEAHCDRETEPAHAEALTAGGLGGTPARRRASLLPTRWSREVGRRHTSSRVGQPQAAVRGRRGRETLPDQLGLARVATARAAQLHAQPQVEPQ